MSRRQRRVRERSLRQRAALEKALRRRGRLAAVRPAAAAATAAALTLAGGTLPVAAATSGGTVDSAASAVAGSGVLRRPDARVVSASLAGCGNAHTPASNARDFTDVGGKVFFTANDGVHGAELWTSDGTTASTVLVKDIKPHGASDQSYGPAWLTEVGGKLFFTANDGTHASELWSSDGTKAGTVLVKDIAPGARYGYGPSELAEVAGRLFFTADDGSHGRELWSSDGTKAGTVLVKDIRPGGDSSRATSLTEVGGRLFFTADDGTHGSELWSSDGTEAGTVLVKDINLDPPAYYDYGPSNLTAVAGRLFFTTDDGTHGNELWTSDGSEAGTVLVKDIHPDAYDSAPSSLTDVGGRLFFAARDGIHGAELWSSDGTEVGTVLVKDIRPVAHSSDPSSLTGAGGKLFFFADDGSRGAELWSSDGTEAGTVLVKDIKPGAGKGYGPTFLTDVGGRLLFAAEDGIHGSEPWTSDSTAAGTVMVKDVNQGGAFTVAKRGTRNFRKATLTLRVRVAGAGRLVVGPARGSLIRTSGQDLQAAGPTTATLRPTKAGMSKLRHALRRAHRHGGHVGKLAVHARFTFTPCGGTPSSLVHRYTLKLK